MLHGDGLHAMSEPLVKKSWQIAAVAVAAVGLSALLFAFYWANRIFDDAFGEDYRLLESIHPGMTVEEVVGRLGPPDLQYSAESAPENYYVTGYAYKRRPITNMVYIYILTEPIGYVYFDRDERVEEMVIRGS